MLQARPSPGATRSAWPPGPGTPSGPTSATGTAFKLGQEQGLDLPGDLEAALCDYLVRLAEDGKRMATIRQARAAIIRGADLAGWPKPGGPGVAEMMRGLGRILPGPRDRRCPSTPRP